MPRPRIVGSREQVSSGGAAAVLSPQVVTSVSGHAVDASTREADLLDIRRELERQRQQLLDDAGVSVIQESANATFPDVSDQATAEADQRFAIRIRERERNLIKKIDEALARMSAHVYGLCERCGEDIPTPRLKARPVTTLCIACKTMQEEQEQVR
ncbi:MAG: TraR/DksA C4-type zinc finger protein [Nitrospiraceae bacterium]